MQDFVQKIEEISTRVSDEIADPLYLYKSDADIIKSAIYEAIEAVLTMGPVMWGISSNGQISSAEFHKSFAEEKVETARYMYPEHQYEIVPLYCVSTAALLEEIRKERK